MSAMTWIQIPGSEREEIRVLYTVARAQPGRIDDGDLRVVIRAVPLLRSIGEPLQMRRNVDHLARGALGA